ncbi:unnamed protein product [Clonostachys rosea]|uniref:Uncharacterized protein n=1 Tax=Bionectria ochroleuca TaxID=29856 RepID=A0ABY6USN4_BIOOC|nr:unnamed protein product [Clonostachys rosea]
MQHKPFFHNFVVGFARLILKTYREISGVDSHSIKTGIYYISEERYIKRCWCPQLHDESQKVFCPFLTKHPGDKAHLFKPLGINGYTRPCPDPSHSANDKSRHSCVNVVYMAYKYMFWFIMHRVPLHYQWVMRETIPKQVDDYLENVFRQGSLASGGDDGKALVWSVVWELENPRDALPRGPTIPSHIGEMTLLRRLFNEYVASHWYREDNKVDVEEEELWTEVLPREMWWMSIQCNKGVPATTVPTPDGNFEVTHTAEKAPHGNLKRSFPYNNMENHCLEQISKKRKRT